MNIVTVSSKYQIVIPEEIRKLLRILPGQKYQVIAYESGRIALIPLKNKFTQAKKS